MKKAKRILSTLLAAALALTVTTAVFAEEPQSNAIDKEAFDALVKSGPVADDDTIAASEWASKVKEAGFFV